MSDFSKLSTEELLSLYQKAKTASPQAPAVSPASPTDYSGISTDELLQLYAAAKQPAPTPQPAAPPRSFAEASPPADPNDRRTQGFNKLYAEAGKNPEQGLRDLADMGLGAADTASLGFADELYAGGKSLFGGDYDKTLESYRQRVKEAGPAYTIGQFAGALPTVFLPGGPLAAATRAGRAGKAALAAGGQAGTYAFGSAEGGGEARAKEALKGFLIGAPLGAGASLLTRAGLTPAEKRLNAALTADKVDTAALPKGAALLDVAGEATARQARAVNTRGSPASVRLAEQLQQRAGARADRLRENVATGLSGKNLYESTDELLAARKAAADPLYEAAFAEAKPVDTAKLLAGLDEQLQDAAGGIETALQKARGFLVRDGSLKTSLRSLHHAKLALDDAIDAAGKDSSLGRLAKRELIDVRNKLLSAIDDANPTYAKARAAYAGPSQSMEALDIGRSLLAEDAELGAREIAKLSAGDKEFVKVGLARALNDAIGRGEGKPGLAKSLLAGDKGRRARAAFDSDEQFQAFVASIEREAKGAAQEQFITGGSQTAARQADVRALDGVSGKVGRAISAPLETAGKITEWGLDRLSRGAFDRRQARIDDELVDLLISPEAAEEFIRRTTPGQRLAPGPTARIPFGFGPPIIDRSK